MEEPRRGASTGKRDISAYLIASSVQDARRNQFTQEVSKERGGDREHGNGE